MAPPPRQHTDRFAVGALFLAGLCAAMQFAKLAPVMDLVAGELGLGLVAAGLSVSILGIVGVVFAISAGTLVAAIGLGRALRIALFGGAVVALLGSFQQGAATFLASRCLEGFSHLVIVVCAPALMSAHASARDRPVVLALWGCFFGLGFAVTSALAPGIVEAAGWRGLMRAHAVLMVVAGGLVALALRRSGHVDEVQRLPDLAAIVRAHGAVYRSGSPLLLALVFCAYASLFLAMITFIGRFLGEVHHWPRVDIGLFVSLLALVTMGATLTAGLLIQRGLTLFAGLVLAFGGVAAAAFGIFALQLGSPWLVPLVVAMMAGLGLLPGLVFANVPVVAPTPALAALTYSAIAQFGNVGSFAGTPLVAASYQALGWPGSALYVGVMAVVGSALALRLRRSLARSR